MLVVFVASPFHTQLASADGAGLNPSLQSPYFQIRPPLLLSQATSDFSLPFAFAVGALVSGKLDPLLAPRRSGTGCSSPGRSKAPGSSHGAWWAYHVLGWGGYWGWNQVENVALLPWLTATAFLHSVMAQEEPGSAQGLEPRARDSRELRPRDLRHLRLGGSAHPARSTRLPESPHRPRTSSDSSAAVLVVSLG